MGGCKASGVVPLYQDAPPPLSELSACQAFFAEAVTASQRPAALPAMGMKRQRFSIAIVGASQLV